MSLIFDTKEDLHLRMVDLQQKLKESEEERRKLEKTCDALIRAFREDERMHYKALNNQYKNFLEDCRLRKKRNDIILKSLYKVEDRAKSLFNKTEKLKLLKDRYTAYLNQNYFLKKEDIQNPKLKTSPTGETIAKSVHWKTPNLEDIIDNDVKDMHYLHENFKIEKILLETSSENINKEMSLHCPKTEEQNNNLYKFFVKDQSDDILENYKKYKGTVAFQENNKIKPLYQKPDIQNKEKENMSNEIKSENEFSKSYSNTESAEVIHQVVISNKDQSFEKTSVQQTILYSKEKINDSSTVSNTTSHIEKNKNSLLANVPYVFEKTSKDNLELKMPDLKTLSRENSQKNEIEKKNFEVESLSCKSIKNEDLIDELKKDYSSEIISENKIFENDKPCHNSSALTVFVKEDTSFSNENEEVKNSKDFQADTNYEISSNIKIYPKGLDGIDYENETYPDSYYEQPEPTRNMSSIASNVILEEDEYDLEVDQEKALSFNASQHIQTSNLSETNIQLAENDDFEKNYSPSGFSLNLTNQGSRCIKNEPLQPIETKFLDIEKNNEFGRNSVESFQILDQFESEGTNSEKSVEQEKTAFNLPTDESESSKEANVFQDEEGSIAKGNKGNGKSSLIHLLESDSESFQIEHGEPISGNEDSDFDFSFKL